MDNSSLFHSIKELEKSILKGLGSFVIDENKNQIPPLTQMRVIDYMLNNLEKEVIFQKEIEDALNLSKATISDVLNRMEKKGLIERNVNPKDTRSKIIILSEKAKKIFEFHKLKLQKLEKIAEKDITKEELEQFFKIMNKLIKNLEENQE